MVLNMQLEQRAIMPGNLKAAADECAAIFPEFSLMAREQASEGEVLCQAWHLTRDASEMSGLCSLHSQRVVTPIRSLAGG